MPRFHYATEHAPALLWLEDANAGPLHVNQSWRAYTGQDGEALDAANLLSIIHPDDVDEFLRLRKASLNDDAPFEMELRLRRTDGAYRWQMLRMQPLQDENGWGGDWSAAAFDIEKMHRSIEALQFLSEAGETLAVSLDLEKTLERVTELATRHLSDWCVLYTLHDAQLQCVGVSHRDPQQRAYAAEVVARHKSKPESLMMTAVTTGKTICVPVMTLEDHRRGAADEADFQRLVEADLSSVIFTPLRTRGSSLGLLLLGMQHGHHTYTSEDVRAAEELARRAALAIENAQLYEREQLAVRHLRFLADASVALNESLNLTTRLERLIAIVVPQIATWALINLVAPDGSLQTIAAAHRDEKLSLAAKGLCGFYHDLTNIHNNPPTLALLGDGRTRVFTEIDDALLHNIINPMKLSVVRMLGARSAALVPLDTCGRILGSIVAVRVEGDPPFTASDISLLEELARRAAVSIDNAQLFAHEQHVAEMFQAASLPASLPSSPQLTFSGFYEPGRADALIGGDWYDALRLPDGRIVISIGDVVGSGLQAAIVMGSVRQVIRGVAHIYTDPLPILEAADKALQSEQPDRMVTSFVGIIDPIERTLCYALAGHPPPILRHPDGRVEELPGRGLPLGLRSHEEHSYTITLEEGALLILYTDGLIESTHDLCSGLNRLRAAIAEVSVPSDSTLAHTIASQVLGAHPSDDVAVMTVEVHFSADAYRLTHRWRFDARDPLQSRAALDRYLNCLEEQTWKGDYHGAALIFLELIGNVVRHAPGQAEVAIDGSGPAPVLHVLDHGFGFKRSRWDIPADIMSENGRGLFLISAYTEDFQVTYREGGGSHARAILSMRR